MGSTKRQLSSPDDKHLYEEVRRLIQHARLAADEAASTAESICNPYWKGMAMRELENGL